MTKWGFLKMQQIQSVLCRDLGLQYPIFQGGMAYISTAELAAAVSNAGGLGLICSSGLTAAQVAEEIRRCQQLVRPGKPFGVNLMLQSPEITQIIDFVVTAKVPVVTTGAGDPTPHMPKLLAAGVKVIPVIPSVRAAKKAEAAGAYAVVPPLIFQSPFDYLHHTKPPPLRALQPACIPDRPAMPRPENPAGKRQNQDCAAMRPC